MKDVPTPQLGSNSWLSNSDIEMLYKMYDCGKFCPSGEIKCLCIYIPI